MSNDIYNQYIKIVEKMQADKFENIPALKAIQIRKELHKVLSKDIAEFSEEELLHLQKCDKWLSLKNDYFYTFFSCLEEKWWHLFLHQNDRLDWLWKSIAIACSTTGQLILLEFSLSFFKGSGGLIGIILLISQCGFGKILFDNFQKKNQRFIERVVNLARCPVGWEWEIRCSLSALFLFGAIAIDLFVPAYYAKFLNSQASEAIKKREFITAQKVLKLSNSIYPNDSYTLHKLGFIEEYFQNFEEAKDYYIQSIEYVYSLNNLAQIYIQEGQNEKAVQLLLYGLKSDRHSNIVYHFLYKNLAKARLNQKLPEDTIKYINLALKYDNHPEAFCVLGDAYQQKNELATEMGFRQECLIRVKKRPEFDKQKNKSIRRIKEISNEFEEK